MTPSVSIERLILLGGLAGAFLIPLKLSLAYVAIIPAILALLYKHRGDPRGIFVGLPKALIAPLVGWNICVLLSAPLGIDPLESLVKGLRLSTTLLIIPLFFIVAQRSSPLKLLTALIFGQSIAAFHSVLASTLPPSLNRLFLGEVTESGQLALTLMAAIGCSFSIFFNTENLKATKLVSLLAVLNFSVFLTLGFYGGFLGTYELIGLFLVLCVSLALVIKETRLELNMSGTYFFPLFSLALPLLFSALIINLKRGPWLGVATAVAIILANYSRRLLFPVIALLILISISIPQVHTRILESSRDFFIAGGRSEMWEIGIELASKYPTGIGYQNSPFLQKYDPNIPAVHDHFHNNFLNILVETGWLGLAIFVLWIVTLVRQSINSTVPFPDSFLLFTLAAAIISWQVAGIFEYNFGDSEVLLAAFVILGAIAAMLNKSANPKAGIT
jgi:hypothetical protein